MLAVVPPRSLVLLEDRAWDWDQDLISLGYTAGASRITHIVVPCPSVTIVSNTSSRPQKNAGTPVVCKLTGFGARFRFVWSLFVGYLWGPGIRK